MKIIFSDFKMSKGTERCPTCGGSGRTHDWDSDTCWRCGGSGEIPRR